jgi:outer membrane protein OmpA-like peptidoglycan-associated protein
VATEDAVPPPDYHPVFLRSLSDARSAMNRKPMLSIGACQVDSQRRVRLRIQLNDSLGAFLTGASERSMRNVWCEVVDSVGEERFVIKNFSITEQTERDRIPHAVALVVDNSGSMGQARALVTQDAAARLIDVKRPEDMLAILRYDVGVGVENPMTKDPAILRARLRRDGLLGYGGATAILNAIGEAMNVLDTVPRTYRRAVVVITDGIDNSSTIPLDDVVQRARALNIAVHTVDFGEGVARGFMENIARATGGTYQKMYRTRDFPAVFEDMYRKIKNSYVMEFTTEMYGEHIVSVRTCFGTDTALAVARVEHSPQIGDIALLDVVFDVNRWDLKSESRPALDKVYRLLRSYPTIHIEIRGHTDANNNTGDTDHNTKLSQRRADAVMADLVKRGINATRLTARGYGDTMPRADNATPEGRAKNRRTEFVVVGG